MNQSNSTLIGWFSDRPMFTLLLILVFVFGLFMGFAFYLDSQVDRLEEKLDYRPPARYAAESPNVPPDQRISFEQARVGQKIYVPVYSHIYYAGGRPYLLETTLSVRNTDLEKSMMINMIEYYDSEGNQIRSYLDAPLRLRPLETAEFLVKMKDTQGGAGANFLVEWVSKQKVSAPVVEAIMVGSMNTQAICFARPGRVIEDKNP